MDYFCVMVLFKYVCVIQIFMISVMRLIAPAPHVWRLTVAVHLELSWDQTNKHAWVRK